MSKLTRPTMNPADYSISLSRRELVDQLQASFEALYKGAFNIEQLVVQPREALNFCDQVRKEHGYYELPDHVILKSLMNRRKAAPAHRRRGGPASSARYYLPEDAPPA